MALYKLTVQETVTRVYHMDAESEDDALNWRGEVKHVNEVWSHIDEIDDVEEVSNIEEGN